MNNPRLYIKVNESGYVELDIRMLSKLLEPYFVKYDGGKECSPGCSGTPSKNYFELPKEDE